MRYVVTLWRMVSIIFSSEQLFPNKRHGIPWMYPHMVLLLLFTRITHIKDMAANDEFVSLGANEVNADYLNYIDLDCDCD